MKFVLSSQKYYRINEKLEAFRGRWGFRQYVSSKPNKYGAKIVNAKIIYTFELEVYVGYQLRGRYTSSTSAAYGVTITQQLIIGLLLLNLPMIYWPKNYKRQIPLGGKVDLINLLYL